MTNIYILRHAESDHAVLVDRPLTDRGAESALKLITLLKDINLDYLYSSPYIRAYNTMKPLADERKIEIKVIDDLRERKISNKPIDDFSSYAMKSWNDKDFKMQGGESFSEVQKRSIAVIKEILSKNKGKDIAIASHGAALSSILNYFDNSFTIDGFFKMINHLPYFIKLSFDDENNFISMEDIYYFNIDNNGEINEYINEKHINH